MRRISGALAILAIFRVSLSGMPACASVAERNTDHQAHDLSHAIGAVAQTDAPCEDGSRSDCGNAQHNQCAAMTSCLSTLLLSRCADWLNAETPERISVSLAERPLEPTRAPEPPPPRV